MAVIGDRLKELRTGQGITQTQLADKTGLSIAIISNIERGYTGARADVIDKLAAYFSVPADYLMGRTNVRFQGSKKSGIFAERTSVLMDLYNIDVDTLATAAKIPNDVLTQILSGETQPGTSYMASLSAALFTTIDYLIGATDYCSSITCEDEQDLIDGYRRMSKSQRRFLMAELEKIMGR